MISKKLTSSILSLALLFSASVYGESNEANSNDTLGNGKHPYAEKGQEILDSVHEDIRIEIVEYQKQKAMLYNKLSDDAKKIVDRLDRLKYKAHNMKMRKDRDGGVKNQADKQGPDKPGMDKE